MTELSYTAWDDKRYQWPPPEGWYQASDGKWWPEGYGPLVGQGTTEAQAGSDDEASGGERGSSEEAGVAAGDVAQESVSEQEAESGTPVEATSDAGANGKTETDPAGDLDSVVDLDSEASEVATSTDTEYPSETAYESESRLSPSSAGMAASGFASHADGGSSSLGLAGWAETGSSDVRNRVDVGREYDYSPPDGETTELLDSIDVSDDHHVPDVEDFDASAAAGADLDRTADDVSSFETTTDPVDSTLSRLDDLKRQVEEQSFPTHVGGVEATDPESDAGTSGFDPTETLDIDPNDMSLESNPYYGGADDADTNGTSSGGATDESLAAEDSGYGAIADAGFEQGLADPIHTDTESYGFAPVEEPTIDASQVAETRQYGYEGQPGAPVGEQPVDMASDYGESPGDHAGPTTRSPISSPPPAPGRGRTVLYVMIGLLALIVAGVAGYVLFQLQSDDDVVSGGDPGTTAAVGGSAAGPSDTSGQEPGSFSNPHALTGGVRLTVPLSDDAAEVWMLQVREPATSTDVGDELVEVASRIRVRNDGTSDDLTASDLRFVLVSSDGSTGTTADESCSGGDDLDRQTAIEPGRDIEGDICWTVPATEASGALLGIESIHAGGRVHVELS